MGSEEDYAHCDFFYTNPNAILITTGFALGLFFGINYFSFTYKLSSFFGDGIIYLRGDRPICSS